MRKKVLGILVPLAIIFVVGFLLLKVIQPSGTFTLQGDIDLSTTRIYVKGNRLRSDLLQQRTFSYRGFPGSVDIRISGPQVQTTRVALSLKPLIGAHKNIRVSSAPEAVIVAAKTISLSNGERIIDAKIFNSVWMGVVVAKPDSSSMYALHYEYDKGDWAVLNPNGLLDTSKSTVKDAPTDFLQYVTDTAAD